MRAWARRNRGAWIETSEAKGNRAQTPIVGDFSSGGGVYDG